MSARSFRREHLRAIRREERRSMGRAKKVATIAGGLFATAAVIAPAANANTYVVNSKLDNGDGNCASSADGGDDVCTLRDAVNDADNHPNSPAGTADVVTFASDVIGTIQLGDLPAIKIKNDSLDIQGPGADKLTVSGSDSDRIFKIYGFGTVAEDYDVTISGLTLTNGHAENNEIECGFDEGDGGAILSTNFLSNCDTGDAASLTLSKVNIVGNHATGGGGGVAVDQTSRSDKVAASGEATLTVHQSTISGNEAGYDGGGIAMYPGSAGLAIVNSTIANNSADDGVGGGVAVVSAFDFAKQPATTAHEIDNSTITGNNATGQGDSISGSGGGISTDQALTLSSDIVYGNTVTPGEVPAKAASPSDLFTDSATITAGYSMFGTTSGATVTESPAGTNQVGVNPQLGTLQNNGGTTPTELPADTSPAIDAGTANGLTVEQRDTARTIDRTPNNASDGTDVGAVELPAEPQPQPQPNPSPNPSPFRHRPHSCASASR